MKFVVKKSLRASRQAGGENEPNQTRDYLFSSSNWIANFITSELSK